MRWHGSQTIVISKTAPPARTRWPTGHFCDVVALDGQVLADRAGLDADRVQVLLRGEQHLTLRWIRVRAAIEAFAVDRLSPLVPVHAAALARR